MSKHIYTLSLFDKLAVFLKKLTLDTDINDEEGAEIANVTDKLNTVRESYCDRKLEEARKIN